jgi:uncharacterized protein YceH (UPF0502 family)
VSKKSCPLGEDCDLTIAWMKGAEHARDKAKARIEELEAEVARLEEIIDNLYREIVYGR